MWKQPKRALTATVSRVTYGLVIFDCDGVLVDSEPISNRVLAAYLTELGHPTTYEESIRDYMGGAMHRVHDTIVSRSGRALPANFDDAFHARVFAAFERELRPVEGIATVLDALAAAGVTTCVASSGSHERIRVVLNKTGLYSHFGEDRLFSSEDVGRGKPAPDLFLHAAASLGFEPHRCAVVEDSPLGISAALAADMDVYGFAAMTPREKLASSTAVFERMDQLPSLLLA
jgi:HAD superfamily hydrolase (TIGR01509 family)